MVTKRPATGPQSRRADRREALLDAATAVVRAEGPHASMEAMAAAGGVTKPILYRHFGDRDGLVAAIAERFLARLSDGIGSGLSSWSGAQTGGRVLRATVDAYLSLVEDDNNLYRFLVQADARAGNRTTSEFVEQVSNQVADVLRAGLEAGGRDTSRAELWAYGIVGMVHAVGDWWAERRSMARDEVVDSITVLLWSGLDGPRGMPD